jgi:hypothetical protein
VKYLVSLIFLLCISCCGAAQAEDDSLTIEQFQKILDCQRDQVQMVDITNGQALFVVKIAGFEKDKLVNVPSDRRKALIQQLFANGIILKVHDNLSEWLKYKFTGSHESGEPLACSQLANMLLEGRAGFITHVDVIDQTNLLSVQISGMPAKEVVMPAEIKQDMVDEFVRKGVKVEHKPPKQDLSYVLPGFLLAMLGLGMIYMFTPMKLASELKTKPALKSSQPGDDSIPPEKNQSQAGLDPVKLGDGSSKLGDDLEDDSSKLA